MEGITILALCIVVAATLIPATQFLYMLIFDPKEALEVFFGKGFFKIR